MRHVPWFLKLPTGTHANLNQNVQQSVYSLSAVKFTTAHTQDVLCKHNDRWESKLPDSTIDKSPKPILENMLSRRDDTRRGVEPVAITDMAHRPASSFHFQTTFVFDVTIFGTFLNVHVLQGIFLMACRSERKNF